MTAWTEGSWEIVSGDYAPVLPPDDVEYAWYCIDNKWNRPQPIAAHMIQLMLLQAYYYKKARATEQLLRPEKDDDVSFTGNIEPPRWWWAPLEGPTTLPDGHPRCQK